MHRTILFAASMMVCTFASSQVLTLADVKAKSATQLTADDLKQLLPGAKVVNHASSGATRNWVNNVSGDLAASSDGRSNTGGKPSPGSGSGTWKIDDKGTYCVNIRWAWRGAIEDWCRYVFRAGDKCYAFDTLEDTAQASEFEFSK
jgi:hypothetical protein